MRYLLSCTLGTLLLLGGTSCGKEACYECTHPSFCDVNICEAKVTTDDTCTGGSNATVNSDLTNEEYRRIYEDNGYVCTKQ